MQNATQRRRLEATRTWACRLTAASAAQAGFALFEAAVLHPAVSTVRITLGPPISETDEVIDAWSSWAGAVLEGAGNALYESLGPSLAAITTVAAGRPAPWQNELVRRIVSDNELVVGWRTWFGPERVAVFGREVLVDLPDVSTVLEDGGVSQALTSPASALVRGRRDIFVALWEYLDRQRLSVAWPRAATRTAAAQPARHAEPIAAPVTPVTHLDRLIREFLRVALRKAGFEGRGTTFRRLVHGNWQIINVQRHTRADGSIRFANTSCTARA